MSSFNERKAKLRHALQAANLQAWITPSTDPHQSEYVAAYWQARTWISEFTGSAGTAVLTAQEAGCWTDSRYFLQAEKELAVSAFTLHKIGTDPDHIEWLMQNLQPGDRVGIDGRLISEAQAHRVADQLANAGIHLVLDQDPIPEAWPDRPAMPGQPIFEHELRFAGEARSAKIDRMRQALAELGASHALVSALDEVAWLLNLRGADVDYCPVFYAYVLLGQEDIQLFVDPAQLPSDLHAQLETEGLRIRAYAEIGAGLTELAAEARVQFDPEKTGAGLVQRLDPTQRIEAVSPIAEAKAIKNPIEIENLMGTMARDGVALVKTFMWLEEHLTDEAPVTESQLAEVLAGFRAAGENYVCESFPAIVGYAGNGAIVHYRPEPGADANILPEGMLLLDSGGQYLDGTTDVTRTIALGVPTEDQRHHYTSVLRGHIALGDATFPKGTTGHQLDVLARAPLWEYGLNFGHGTGHGVGFFLNVHEGPQSIRSTAKGSGLVPMEPGMVTSNEPGLYLEGEYGIRIENLVLCEETAETDFGLFYSFADLTQFPMDINLVDFELLNADEIDWLVIYHMGVMAELEPLLNEEEVDWLAAKCLPFIEARNAIFEGAIDLDATPSVDWDDMDWDIGGPDLGE